MNAIPHKIINFTSIALFLTLILQVSLTKTTKAYIIDIDIATDKQVYNVGDPICIVGNVTANGTPVYDALATIEIQDPNNQLYLIRTVKTGENLTGYWQVQILDLYTCDSNGNPKNLFNKGKMAYALIKIKNINTLLSYHIKVAFYIQYSDNSPFMAYYPFETTIEPQQEMTFIGSIPIPTSAIPGEAVIFANVLSEAPSNGGYAYCPEKTTSFYIDTTTPLAQPQPQYFNIIFKLPRTNVKIGNYTIYAKSFYLNSIATEIRSFKVVLLGDLVKDGKIDMRDIGAICKLYGTRKDNPNWNPEADLYEDGVINMRDIGRECNNFGKTAIY
jgi:hypothetical protein